MKIIDLEADYSVVDGNDVTLSIIIGDGQVGGSVVTLDGVEIGKKMITNLKIGAGATLKNKRLLARTVVLDVNPATNNMSVTWQFTGGVAPHTFRPTPAQVANQGDMMAFRGKFRFI